MQHAFFFRVSVPNTESGLSSRMSDITPDQSASQISFDPSAADSGYNFLSNVDSDALLSTTSTRNANDKVKGTIYLVEEGDQRLLKRANEHLRVIQEHALLI